LDLREDMSGPLILLSPLTSSGELRQRQASIQPLLQGMLLTTLISHGSRASFICCSQKYRIKDRGVPHCATEIFPTVPTQPAPVFRHHVRGSGCPTRRKRRLDPCSVAWQDILTLKTSRCSAFSCMNGFTPCLDSGLWPSSASS
jgi:hypothetical protein